VQVRLRDAELEQLVADAVREGVPLSTLVRRRALKL
jgi:hypothetical protein